MVTEELVSGIADALSSLELPGPAGGITLEPPRQREHGDWSTNVALQLAKTVGRKPRDVAESIAEALRAAPPPHLNRVEVAGPGFLNFHLSPSWLHEVLLAVVTAGDRYGKSDALVGQRINLEFVSANPTGPLHAGGGRWIAVGDALANLLAAQGAEVCREYYLNDAGNQLDTFGRSLHARYLGETLPVDGYHGSYLIEMAERLRAERGDGVDFETAREWGYEEVVRELRTDLERIGVHFDVWFSERVLHERSDVASVIEILGERGYVDQRDGATWFRATDFGDQRDRVLVKSDGALTYLATDLAYHRDKFDRGFDHLIDIWGADHHGQVRSVQAGMEALGFTPGEPEIILGQLVTLMRGGQPVRISKRTGDMVTLSDILDEVDPDACRLTFLLAGIDTSMNFDLDLATAQSMDNPVYYVQYAHARIMSIGRKATEQGIERMAVEKVDLSVLIHERELELLRSLAEFPDVVADAASFRSPQKVTTWVRELAGRFHGFYHDCRVVTDDLALTQARLWLTEACRIGFAAALALLGVSAPDEMTRLDEGTEQ